MIESSTTKSTFAAGKGVLKRGSGGEKAFESREAFGKVRTKVPLFF